MSRKKVYYTYPKMKRNPEIYARFHPPTPWWWRPLLVILVGAAVLGAMTLSEADPLDRDYDYDNYYSESYGPYTSYRGTTEDGDKVSGSRTEYTPGWTVQEERVYGEDGSYEYHHCEVLEYGSIRTVNCN